MINNDGSLNIKEMLADMESGSPNWDFHNFILESMENGDGMINISKARRLAHKVKTSEHPTLWRNGDTQI